MKYQNFMTISLKSTKKLMKESLKEVKSNSWKQQYDPKNFRALNYQL